MADPAPDPGGPDPGATAAGASTASRAVGDRPDGAEDPAERCACGVEGAPPWTPNRGFFGPLAFACGLAMIALGVVGANAGKVAWFAPAVAGAFAVSAVAAGVVQWRAGHRGGCLVSRIAWLTICGPGIPLRLAVGLAV